MLGDGPSLHGGPPLHGGEPRGGCYAALTDLLVGGLEVLVVAMTAIYTGLGAPPDSAPRSEYNHVVNIYTGVIMGTIMIALIFYVLRRRWIASALQLIVVALAIASVVFLHHTRVSGGLTGY
jgi:1,4-dihydroxy-2-naphthoate octaprenyltransferase